MGTTTGGLCLRGPPVQSMRLLRESGAPYILQMAPTSTTRSSRMTSLNGDSHDSNNNGANGKNDDVMNGEAIAAASHRHSRTVSTDIKKTKETKRARHRSPPNQAEKKPKKKEKRERSGSPKRKSRAKDKKLKLGEKKKRKRSTSSSSRDTFDGFQLPGLVKTEIDDSPFRCDFCGRGKLYSIKEVAEHEIRAHDQKIRCAHCERVCATVSRLATHMKFRHPSDGLVCSYCKEDFGGPADRKGREDWENFRTHVYEEVLKKKMYVQASRGSNSNATALRGVGRCPHGPPVKCKNFPNCPGERCIYAHGQCRFDKTCVKSTCPFDHSNKPRKCIACVNDFKDSECGGGSSRRVDDRRRL